MLRVERKRAERSGRRFVLMLLDAGKLVRLQSFNDVLGRIVADVSRATRETDIQGWYAAGSIFGVIFTEIGAGDGRAVAEALRNRISQALCGSLSIGQISEIDLSFHIYPEEQTPEAGRPSDSLLYPDLEQKRAARTFPYIAKRVIDIVGSLLALAGGLPLFLVIAAAIKLTSPGPVFFRQIRVGQFGRRFTFFKFRSMYVGMDAAIHKKYMQEMIRGTAAAAVHRGDGPFFKLTADPRITPMGAFLRRTSLDELPQFINVLRGEMSLVGPRPPIPYEVNDYEAWHKPRLLAMRSGITGMWQVGGRNRLKFDEMVRLDLHYAACWTLWLDLKILLKTPRAVLDGA